MCQIISVKLQLINCLRSNGKWLSLSLCYFLSQQLYVKICSFMIFLNRWFQYNISVSLNTYSHHIHNIWKHFFLMVTSIFTWTTYFKMVEFVYSFFKEFSSIHRDIHMCLVVYYNFVFFTLNHCCGRWNILYMNYSFFGSYIKSMSLMI